MTNEQKLEKRVSDGMQYLARILWDARPKKKKTKEKTEAEKKADAERKRKAIEKGRKADAERKRKEIAQEKANIKTLYENQRGDSQ